MARQCSAIAVLATAPKNRAMPWQLSASAVLQRDLCTHPFPTHPTADTLALLTQVGRSCSYVSRGPGLGHRRIDGPIAAFFFPPKEYP